MRAQRWVRARASGQQAAGDPCCPRLVCRVRGHEDVLKVGMGGQRVVGPHVRWIRNRNLEGVEGEGIVITTVWRGDDGWFYSVR
ncbi:uncharacterized protein C8Q71DRAFT_534808 [Rhodofomes roseus]|uniref:Uncharacterized protein n=1 Tax=Rhodofomes roseus TaxID=34475 RepID=A0ABQ8KK90_9APHY|nr:uncharacterized protein C8Q71DRAFT_534808 [Rhodofomes roseus]KAH9838535.1 hypothetical protein C8Q71DRAFT_534808 [Rhodofomes roseus]